MKHCPGKRIDLQIVGKAPYPRIFICLKRTTCQHYYVKGNALEEMEMKDNCDEYQPMPPEAA